METVAFTSSARRDFLPAHAKNLPFAVPAPSRPHAAQQAIFIAGDPADQLFEIESGAVMVLRLLPDGRRQILDIAGPGRLIGLTAGAVQDCSAIALRPTRVRSASAAQQSPAVLRAMFTEIHRLRDLATALGRKTAAERIAGFLVALAQGGGASRLELRVPVSRQEIADHLGLAIETVCRNFKALERRGLIGIDGFFGVTILDETALRRIAEGGAADAPKAQRLQA
jgi:CRP/FNR family transcriptional regulator